MRTFRKSSLLAYAFLAIAALFVAAPRADATTSCSDSLAWGSKGVKPAGRWNHTAIWDSDSERVVVFGGWNKTTSTTYKDVVAFRPKTNHWDTLSTSGPARANHTAIYDPVGKRMLVYGGYTGSGTDYLYSFSLTSHTWSQPTTTGTSPGFRAKHLAIYSPLDSSMIIVGGEGSNSTTTKKLKLSTMTWSSLPDWYYGYSARRGAAGIYDPVGRRLLMCGGAEVTSNTVCSGSPEPTVLRDDVWSLNLTGTPAWTQLTYGGDIDYVTGATAFYEPQCHRMILYGGVGEGSVCSNCGPYCNLAYDVAVPHSELASFDLDTDTWSNSRGYVSQPPARGYHSLAYDAHHRRAFVFGGGGFSTVPGSSYTTILSDNWQLQVTDLTPAHPITNLFITNCTSSSLDLSWTAPADDNDAAVGAYDVRQFTEPIDDSNWDSATPVDGSPGIPGNPGTTESFTVSGLDACTWYYYAVKSVDIWDNVSSLSNGASGRTRCSGSSACLTGEAALRPVSTSREVATFALSQPVPNPTASEVVVSFSLPSGKKSTAELGVYDLVGRRIATLDPGQSTAGRHAVRWNLLDAGGRRVSSGMYWVRLQSEGEIRTRSIVVR